MENSDQWLKCKCGVCGEVIEYPADAAGQVVECPKCQQHSLLPERLQPAASERLRLAEAPESPVVPTPIPASASAPAPARPAPACPACGGLLETEHFTCPACARHRRRMTVVVGLAAALVLLALGLGLIALLNRPKAKAIAAGRPRPAGSTTILAQPRVPGVKSLKDLKPGQFQLQRDRKTSTLIALGEVQNLSQNVHTGVKVDMDIFDARGVKIGSLSSMISLFKPNTRWQIVERVSQPNAAAIRFAGIKENQ